MAKLSKSRYVRGRRCTKRLWLHYRQPELASAPSAFSEGILEQGREVGELARQWLTGGELISEDHHALEQALLHTQSAIQNGATVLYEAAFSYQDLIIRVDILRKNLGGTWDLIEVKSSTNRGKPKRDYIQDVAVQKYVLQGIGLPIGKTFLLRLNRNYRKQGPLDFQKLFVLEEMDSWIATESALVPQYLTEFQKALETLAPPAAKIGSVCKGSPECEFKSHCWGELPANSIHYLTYLRDGLREELVMRKIETISEIPPELLSDFKQLRHVESELKGEAAPDEASLKQHLSLLKYPLYFLDFETYGYALPRYEGTRPYQRLPFQFSLHIQENPGGPITHHEYLCEKPEDPRPACVDALVNTIGPLGSVIVYHADFERGILEELAEDFPTHADKLNLTDRLWDLEVPFAQRWICRASFKGRSSIKNILPAMVPGFGYDDLAIKAGDVAMRSYYEFIDDKTTPSEKAKLRQQLLEYCKRDTWAMVKILEKLRP